MSRTGWLDPHHSRAPSGSAAARSRASRGSVRSSSSSSTASTARRAAWSARCQRSSQPSSEPAPPGVPVEPDGRRDVGGGALRVGPAAGSLRDHHVPARRSGARRAVTEEGELRAGQPGPARRDDQVGPVLPDELRRRRAGTGRRTARRARGGRRTRARRAPASPPARPARPGPARRSRRRRRPPRRVRSTAARARRASRPGPGNGSTAARRGARRAVLATRSSPPGTSGSRKGRLRWTGPGRPPTRARRVRPGLAGQRAPVAGRARPGLGQAGLAEPAHRGAVQLDLVDGLVGADPPQLRRPVGGEHDQRHAPTRRPRSPPGGSWPPPCPRCTAPPPGGGWPWPGRAR